MRSAARLRVAVLPPRPIQYGTGVVSRIVGVPASTLRPVKAGLDLLDDE